MTIGIRIILTCALLLATAEVANSTPEIEVINVEGGCYQMGDTFGDGSDDEKPVHEVCVDDFYIGKYPVTQAQWQSVMKNNPSHFKDCGGNCPVEQILWEDAWKFIDKLNELTGKKYRLPTEAEWEYAARSRGKHDKYSGGNRAGSVAWYSGNSGGRTHPVGRKVTEPSGNIRHERECVAMGAGLVRSFILPGESTQQSARTSERFIPRPSRRVVACRRGLCASCVPR